VIIKLLISKGENQIHMNKTGVLIAVGEIVNTHGIKGEVKVKSLTDFPERFKSKAVLIWEKDLNSQELTIEKVRSQNEIFLIKFNEVQNIDEALKIKGGLLKISSEQLKKLPADTYYIFELIGMEVQTDDGIILGKIKDIIQTGSNDVYVVNGTKKEYLIPAIRLIVQEIDKSKGTIIIKPMEGLLDL
jgi:16S rRNA processing protein RimM